VSYRDDREALLMRAEALERELAKVRADNERLQQEARAAEQAEAAADDEAPDPAPATALVPVAPPSALALARVPVPPGRAERTRATWAAGLVGLAWSALALALGTAPWMVPVSIASVLGAAWFALGAGSWVATRALRTRWPSLPIELAAYRELITRERRSVVVQLDVSFARPISRADRERVRQQLRGAGAIRFDGGNVTITSATLRTRKSPDGTFDPAPIRAFCDRAFDRLAELQPSHPMTVIRPRAKAR